MLGQILYNEDSEPIVVNLNSRKAIAEQFRAIRTNMQFLQTNASLGKGKVTLFTSSMSGEGKSFVASNLATALAIKNKKIPSSHLGFFIIYSILLPDFNSFFRIDIHFVTFFDIKCFVKSIHILKWHVSSVHSW